MIFTLKSKWARRLAFRMAKVAGFNPSDSSKYGLWSTVDDDTGLSITTQTSMQITAASAAVRLIAESVAQLPLQIFIRDGLNKTLDDKNPLFHIMHTQPNNYQTPYEFKVMLMAHCLTHGAFYGEIIGTNGRGVDQIIPRDPDRVVPFWSGDGVRAYYYYPTTGGRRTILQNEMFHLMWFSTDGLNGMDPITNFRRTLGLSIGAEKYGARFYKNDATPRIALQMAGTLKDPARQNLKESWNAAYGGVNNSSKVAILEEGLTVKEISISPENAQFLETRKFQVSDIARIFRVPPHMIGDLDKATFSNIEMQSLEFVIYTLTPWLTMIEQGANRSLLNEDQRKTHFFQFLIAALLRGDIKTRYEAYAKGRQWGWLNVNEIRRFENMNGIGTQGETYLVPMNMVPADELRDMSQGQTAAQQRLALMMFLDKLETSTAIEQLTNGDSDDGKE